MRAWGLIGAAALTVLGCSRPNNNGPGPTAGENCVAPDARMSFFVTEAGTGERGGNLGGLMGADEICRAAAEVRGVTGKTWRAYLSAVNDATFGRVDARDRIGSGPWFHHGGESIGDSEKIHHAFDTEGIPARLVRTECGRRIKAQEEGGTLFELGHDVLTGSNGDGVMVGSATNVLTCNDWTSNSPGDSVVVGHTNHKLDLLTERWNTAHATQCDQSGMAQTLAIGRIYCFALQPGEQTGPTDGGTTPTIDGGVPPPVDSGVAPGDTGGPPVDTGTQTPTDSGPQPPADGGTSTPEAGPPADTGPMSADCTQAPDPRMSFFVSDNGSNNAGGNLGGVAAADAFCQGSAETAGIMGKTWHAYLSASADATFGRVDARDRIGAGPWFNFNGMSVGDLAQIHMANDNVGIHRDLIRTECGRRILDYAETTVLFERAHDVYTGSTRMGTLATASNNTPATCADWTSDMSFNVRGRVGHTNARNADEYWNDAHDAVCDGPGLRNSLGIGRIYCFAID